MRNLPETETVTTESTTDVEDLPALTMAVTPRHRVVGTASTTKTTQACITILACDIPLDGSRRAPVDIVVALDVSGSMGGEKLNLCKQTLKLLLRQLTQEDRFGLVTFASDVITNIPTEKMTPQRKALALNKIMALGTRGMTNLSGGIGQAAQEIRSVSEPNDVRTIFLLTDGHANEGVTESNDIAELASGCLNCQDPPISLHCFGYGTDHNDELLRTISGSTQGGTYYFVETDSSVTTAFGDALGGILSVVAQNAVIQIAVPEAARVQGVQIENVFHEKATKMEDGSFRVNVGDFYAEESRDILASVVLAKKDLGEVPHLTVSLSYTDTINKMLAFSNNHGCFVSRPLGATVSVPDPRVEVQWLRVDAVREMDNAYKLSTEGRLEEARATIDGSLAKMTANLAVRSNSLVVQMVEDLNSVSDGLSSASAFSMNGAKMLSSKRQTHAMQRCMEPTPEATNKYRSKRKAAFACAFRPAET